MKLDRFEIRCPVESLEKTLLFLSGQGIEREEDEDEDEEENKEKKKNKNKGRKIKGYTTSSGDPIFAKLKLAIEVFAFPHPSPTGQKRYEKKRKETTIYKKDTLDIERSRRQ